MTGLFCKSGLGTMFSSLFCYSLLYASISKASSSDSALFKELLVLSNFSAIKDAHISAGGSCVTEENMLYL